MPATPSITLFHAPQTRSTGALALLEELGAPYELRLVDIHAGDLRAPAFRAINPLGKVPTILDGGVPVTEQVAICIHLADRFPGAGLAPPIGDPRRGPYLRWLAYYAACYEPALVDKAHGRPPAPASETPYGDFDAMLDAVEGALRPGPYLLGASVTAADILWGIALEWGMMFGLVPRREAFVDYAGRIMGRDAVRRVGERDAALAAEQAAARERAAATA
jgi:glutathione S-transferase